jgi:hypothetical protein
MCSPGFEPTFFRREYIAANIYSEVSDILLPYFLHYLFFVYSLTLLVVQIIYCRICKAIELEIDGSVHGLILGIIFAFDWRNWEEPWKLSVRIVGPWTAIRTRDLTISRQDF